MGAEIQRILAVLLGVVLVTGLLLLVLVYQEQRATNVRLDSHEDRIIHEIINMTPSAITDTIPCPRTGGTRDITSTQETGESDEDFVARHNALVAAAVAGCANP